ncbi:M23 family metallopeptidase [Mycolicibacterium cosmeticum]|uniref:M23 family metallopeptidase n=1 Tax=Mycolicibacterium cosmeticum TaxID=258533 RepID=UPI003204A20A
MTDTLTRIPPAGRPPPPGQPPAIGGYGPSAREAQMSHGRRIDAPPSRPVTHTGPRAGLGAVTANPACDDVDALTVPAAASGRAFDHDFRVLHCRELDDDADGDDDQRPLVLATPAPADGLSPGPGSRHRSARHRRSGRARSPARHRRSATGPAPARALMAALAAGAVAAAAHAAITSGNGTGAPVAVTTGADEGMQIVTLDATPAASVLAEEFVHAVAFAQERAQRETRLQRPLYASPTRGILTSGFGTRWGVLHGGIDVANAIGTPINAPADGVVIAAGPVAGFGMWVKLRHDDGTVTLFGHIDRATVQTGQHVMAGDQIALMGNTGNSTGPHLHFEVHLAGDRQTDPLPWLAERGVPLSALTG